MNIQTAMLVQNLIAIVLFVFWLCVSAFVWLTLLRERTADQRSTEPDSSTHPLELNPGEELLSVEADVEGDPDVLADRASQVLAQGKVLGPVRVIADRANQVGFSAGPGQPLVRGVLEFQRRGSGRTRILATFVRVQPSRALLWLALGFSVLGLVSLTVTYLLIDRLVARHANPQIRIQVVQMCQAIHLMWEPLLFAGLYRKQRSMTGKSIDSAVDTLVYNLPFFPDSTSVK